MDYDVVEMYHNTVHKRTYTWHTKVGGHMHAHANSTQGFTAIAALGLFAGVAADAIAQQGGAAATADMGLEVIVVTAQKREQSTREVPATVSVLSAEALESAGVKDLFQAASLVPGATFSRAPDDGLQLTIRGLGTPARTQSFDQSVALFLDGAFLGKGRLYSGALFDAERIEFIKGTQSTLLGKNTSLGAISVVSKRPADELEGTLSASAEVVNGGGSLDAAISLPFSDTIRMRLAGHYNETDGWVNNSVTGNDVPRDEDLGVRATWVLEPNSSFDATLIYQYSDTLRVGNGYQFVDPNGVLPAALGEGRLDDTKAGHTSAGRDGESYHDIQSNLVNLAANWELGAHVLTAMASYADYELDFVDDFDFGAKDATYFVRTENYSQRSAELRLTSEAARRFSYLIGLFYFESDWESAETQIYDTPLFIPPLGGNIFQGGFTNDFTQKTETVSAFVSTTFRISDTWRLNTGLRYTDETKDATWARPALAPLTPWNQIINPPFARTVLPFADDFFNGNISIQYDVTPDATLYFGFGRGTKTGGYAESAQVITGKPLLSSMAGGSAVASEEADTFELGVKGTGAGRRISYELAAFHTEVSNFQDTTFTGTSFDTANVDVRSYGMEASLVWQFADPLRLDTSWTYARAEITEPSKRPVAGAPRWTGRAGVLFDQEMGSTLRLFANTYLRYRDEMVHQRISAFRSEPLTTWDASIGVGSQSERWEVSLNARNITNEISADFSGPPADPTIDPSVRVEAPSPLRTVRIDARVRF